MAAPLARSIPLLICSIGNPGSTYAHTLHSAGHTILTRLAAHLDAPPFRKDRTMGNGLVTRVGDWTLWQSPAYMNESGASVRAAWQTFHKTLAVGEEGRLVIVHDELERAMGAFAVKTKQGLSAKGHNGLKSILASLAGSTTPFVRVGVGIGRPASRDSDDVARYVLRKMSPTEREAVEGCVEALIVQLEKLQTG